MPGNRLSQAELSLLQNWNSTFFSLRGIHIGSVAPLRGLRDLRLEFRYPLTVISGKNGTGKSTLLACAACSYCNYSEYNPLYFRKKYFNFNDFFVSSQVDDSINGVIVTWSYRSRAGRDHDVRVIKRVQRWAGYRRRPERTVEFLGLIRVPHPFELRVNRTYFGERSTIRPKSLSNPTKTALSKIMTKQYSDVQCATREKRNMHVFAVGDTRYSAFNAGSGEDISCLIEKTVDSMPRQGLLIIEEIETGLHPSAQRKLIEELLDACLRKQIQIICSTHSPTILESVPNQARILLTRQGNSIVPRYGVSVSEAISELGEIPVTQLAVYVEDDVAKQLVLCCTPAEVRCRIRVVESGNWDDVIRMLAAYRIDPELGNAIGVIDGEQGDHANVHNRAMKKYMRGDLSEEDRAWFNNRLFILPGGVAPERQFIALGGNPDFKQILARHVKAKIETIDRFFAAPHEDHHSIPFALGIMVGLSDSEAMNALCSACVEYLPNDYEQLSRTIASRLDP